jgi:hypothetical protein
MADGPILFGAPMVRSILRPVDPKTQTRRLLNPQPGEDIEEVIVVPGGPSVRFSEFQDGRWVELRGLRWEVGDKLWVRESHWSWGKWEPNGERKDGRPAYRFHHHGQRVVYERPGESEPMAYFGCDVGWSYHPGIHMPRWASRITLEVADVRVERLMSINEDDARAEGFVDSTLDDGFGPRDIGGGFTIESPGTMASAAGMFQIYWQKIHPEWDGWSDPWVCALTFRRVPNV